MEYLLVWIFVRELIAELSSSCSMTLGWWLSVSVSGSVLLPFVVLMGDIIS